MDWLERARLLFGEEALQRLAHAHVALFGVGGVGGHCAEALIRSGIGALSLFDMDTVSATNINRQLIATWKTVGMSKVDVMRLRLLDINPEADILPHAMFYLPENADEIDLTQYDYIIDAVDTVAAKIELAVRATKYNIPIISCMGTGNKLDPTRFCVADIYQTSVCPLARVMRHELKKRGIPKLRVVYSTEEPRCIQGIRTPGSNAFCPSVAGLILASVVVRDIAGTEQNSIVK